MSVQFGLGRTTDVFAAALHGDYPIPLFSDDMRQRVLPHGGIAPRGAHVIPADFVSVSEYAYKLRAVLPSVSSEAARY